jgi:hypothetical protein
MLIANDLFLGIALRAAERTGFLGAPSGAGAVDGQADPVAVVESLVALGTPDDGEQGFPGRAGIQALGEIP